MEKIVIPPSKLTEAKDFHQLMKYNWNEPEMDELLANTLLRILMNKN